MKTFKKYYVGKGKQVKGLPIIKVTCTMDDLNALCYEYDGTLYITFEVAKMKSPDQFGREYTVYVNRKEDSQDEPKDEKNTPKPKTTGKRRNVRESIEEAPELN